MFFFYTFIPWNAVLLLQRDSFWTGYFTDEGKNRMSIYIIWWDDKWRKKYKFNPQYDIDYYSPEEVENYWPKQRVRKSVSKLIYEIYRRMFNFINFNLYFIQLSNVSWTYCVLIFFLITQFFLKKKKNFKLNYTHF